MSWLFSFINLQWNRSKSSYRRKSKTKILSVLTEAPVESEILTALFSIIAYPLNHSMSSLKKRNEVKKGE